MQAEVEVVRLKEQGLELQEAKRWLAEIDDLKAQLAQKRKRDGRGVRKKLNVVVRLGSGDM